MSDMPPFLHPEHEILFTRLEEIDETLQRYKDRLVIAMETRDPAGISRWSVMVHRRLLGIWEEARDRFLSTLS